MKLNTFFQLTSTLTLGLLASGCASITTGQNQSLSVETSPEAGAVCELANDKGKWYVSATPGTVTVNRAYGDLVIKCTKGSKSGVATVRSSTKGMAFGNILAGGIIGGAVDVGTGAAYDYPSSIHVPLQENAEKVLAENKK